MLKRLSILLMSLIITFTSINFENVYADNPGQNLAILHII